MRKNGLSAILLAAGLFCLVSYTFAGWGAVKRLTWTSGRSQYPAVATDSGKTAHVVWQDQTPGNWEIYYRKGS
jgi:hypothetical protein